VEQLFAPSGPLSRALEGYEWRPEQAEMARAVARTFRDGGTLVVEAPTGVGKTLAYLVPAALRAREGVRIVLASTTKNLQEQILRQDVPRARRMLGDEFPVAVLKGRSSYICARRLAQFEEQAGRAARERRFLDDVRSWIAETETGEVEEFESLGGTAPSDLWRRVASDGAFCSSRECARPGCFYRESRRRARNANLIVVNHALLFSEIFSGGAGIPEFDAAVLDEAHNVERIATEHLAVRFGLRAMAELVDRGPGRTDEDAGSFAEVRRWARSHLGGVARLAVTRALRDAAEADRQAMLRAEEFLAEVALLVGRGEASRRRYRRHEAEGDLLARGLDPLATALRVSSERARSAHGTLMTEAGSVSDESREEVENLLAEHVKTCEELARSLTFLTSAREPGYVYWVEREESLAALTGAPLHVGAALRTGLVSRLSSLVLTSATLTAAGQFDYILERLGLDSERPATLQLPSPFDLESQVLAVSRTAPPRPDEAGYLDFVAAFLAEASLATRRKILALFTSHEALRRTRSALAALGPSAEVLAQGVDGGRGAVTEAFRREGPAILLGAASFWEGVDFPGEQLEVLALVRLPFPVPSDPMTEARCERCEEDGGDGFRGYMLPEAILRFRQGFGRLVRRRTDRGVIVVLDPRLVTSSYGALFRRSVAVDFEVSEGGPADLALRMARWFAASD